MAATYRSSTSISTGSTAATSTTLAVPGDIQINDLLFAAMNVRNAVTPTVGTSVTIDSTATATAWNALAVEVLPAVRKNIGTLGVG